MSNDEPTALEPSMGTERRHNVDSRALEVAVQSLTLTRMHVEDCAKRNDKIDRYIDSVAAREAIQVEARNAMKDELIKKIDELRDRTDLKMADQSREFQKALWKIVASTIGLLVICLGYYLVTFGLPGEEHYGHTTTTTTTHTVP